MRALFRLRSGGQGDLDGLFGTLVQDLQRHHVPDFLLADDGRELAFSSSLVPSTSRMISFLDDAGLVRRRTRDDRKLFQAVIALHQHAVFD